MRYNLFGHDIDDTVAGQTTLTVAGQSVGTLLSDGSGLVTVNITSIIQGPLNGIAFDLKPSAIKIRAGVIDGKLSASISGNTNVTHEVRNGVFVFIYQLTDHTLDNQLVKLAFEGKFNDFMLNNSISAIFANIYRINLKNELFLHFTPSRKIAAFSIINNVVFGDDFISTTTSFSVDAILLFNFSTKLFLQPVEMLEDETFRPVHLPIHPDTFSLNQASFPDADFTNCSIKFSAALINGSLCLEDPTHVSWTAPFSEEHRLPGNPPPAMLLLHSLDEHGHPVAVINEDGKLPLTRRKGIDVISDNRFDLTINGIVPGNNSRLTLHSISHESIDFDKKEEQLIKHKNTNDKSERPYWLPDNGAVMLETQPPLALHGLTKGSWFELKKNAAGKYPDKISTSLSPRPHPDAIYELPTLSLQSGDWLLRSQYEERESKQNTGAPPSLTFSLIDGRSFTGSDAGFDLPVTDYLFGASNIFDTQGNNNSAINDFVHTHVSSVNQTIIEKFSALPVDQVHASGFTRQHPNPGESLAVQDLFTHAPLKATAPIDIKILPGNVGKPVVAPAPAAAASPTLAAPAIKRTEPQQVKFNHGDLTKPEGNAPPDILKKLQRVWNEYPLIIEELKNETNNELLKVATAIGRLKQFLEGLSDANREADLRVKSVQLAEKELFYRLKLHYLAPDPQAIGNLTDMVKAIVYGNIADLPGIGNRIFALRKWADNYLANTTKTWQDILVHYWEKTWEDCKEEEEKALYAVFDFVYKLCDRQLLGKLIELTVTIGAVANDVLADLKTLWTYLGQTPDMLKTLKDQFIADAGKLATDAMQGLDPYFDQLRQTWDDLVGSDLACPGVKQKIIANYGRELNIGVYKRLVEDIHNGNSPVTKEIVDCLEKQFRKRMRALFQEELDKLATWSIDALAKFLEPFQEQIFTFYMYAERARDIFQKMKDLKTRLQHVQSAQDVRALADDPLVSEIYPEIRKLALLYQPSLTAALRPFDEIKNSLRQLLIDHQDEIFQVILIINDAQALLEEWQGLKAFIDDMKACPDADDACRITKLKAFFKKDHNSRVLYVIGTLINDEFGNEIVSIGKEVANSVQAAVDKFIDDHSEKIILLLVTFYELKQEVDKWKKIIEHIRTDLRELQRDLATFLNGLTTDQVKQTFLELLILYLMEKYQVDLDIVNMKVEPPQYIAYGKNIGVNTNETFRRLLFTFLEKLHVNKLSLCKFGDLSKTWGCFLNDQSIFILKLGNDMDLGQIITEVNSTNKKPGLEKGPFPDIDEILAHLHPDIDTKLWRGLLVIHPFADLSKDSLITDLIGRTSLKMTYAAFGNGKPDGNDFDVYAHIKEEAALMDIPKLENSPDTHLALIKFEAVIKNTSLESGDALLKLKFKDVFGQQKFGTGKDELDIHGSVGKPATGDKTKQEFEFSAVLQSPFQMDLSDIPLLDTLVIRGITAVRKNNASQLAIKADLNFRKISFLLGTAQVTMSDFAITLPSSNTGSETPPGKPRGVNFDIGAIRYAINQPRSVNIGGIEIIPQSMGYIKTLTAPLHRSLFASVLPIAGHKPQPGDARCVYIDVRVEMGELPVLGGAGSNLNFEGLLASNLTTGNVFFGLKSVSADYISIDLFRFISLYIRKLIIGDVQLKNGDSATFFGVNDIRLKILDWSPMDDDQHISGFILHDKPADGQFTRTPRKGFMALYNDDHPDGFLKIFWLLLAKNLKLDEKVLTALLEPGSHAVQDLLSDAFGALNKTDEMKQLAASGDDYEGNKDYNPSKPIPAANKLNMIDFSDDNTWLFGVSFALGEILDRCTVVLQDRHFYGILLASSQPWFEAIFGTDQLALAYIPGPTRQSDRFRIELRLDRLDFLSALRSGLVAIEMALNKDFLFDFGFPWLVGNAYMMERTFSGGEGVEIRFGFYIQKTTIAVAGNTQVTLGAGLALSYGYKIGARSAFAWAEAGIGVFMIFSGAITFEMNGGSAIDILSARIVRLEATGVIGIYAYAEGGINFWIISASIKAWLTAAIQGHLLYIPGGNSSIDFSAVLSLRYEASARIKLGFVKIEVHISGQLSYGVSGRIALN